MKKRDIEIIKKALSKLVGQSLRDAYRFAGASIHFGFGDMLEDDCFYKDESGKLARDESGKLLRRKSLRPKYALRNECAMRVTCGNEILFAKADIFLPNTKLMKKANIENDGIFDWKAFDWDVVGDNYFDEMIEKYIGDDPFEFVVKKIDVSKFGDLKISFENGFVLELFVDGSGGEESWRFFDVFSEERHLVVLGDGIEDASEE
ncbi:MAG: hypothetical protein FWC69_04660 [Defluviitaleaceae bacterium]|nr:hypothetical protein [Defluviitaleaceae bacterium]